MKRWPTWIRHPREFAGVLVKDLRRYRRALRAPGNAYLQLCNRNEVVRTAAAGEGVLCEWQWGSDLHAPKLLPRLGAALMRRALQDHPIGRAAQPAAGDPPGISFIIGHAGAARVPLLLATLESIAAQDGAAVECIVVEQDAVASLAGVLPRWVRHVHTPPPAASMPFCRSWAFNVGAAHARGALLVLHDNDMLVSRDYGSHLLRHVQDGCEAVNARRFLFYLDERQTRTALAGGELTGMCPEAITQNLQGGSVAITADAFRRIGGMDEGFVGWGGEDNEFWERVRTLRTWEYGALPMVHLWHAPQPGKQSASNPTLRRQRSLATMSPADRIRALRTAPQGRLQGPAGWKEAA